MRTALFLLQAFLPFSSIWAQLPAASFHHLRRDERLMSSFYHCLAEDEYGFIWFGSRHGGGLYRYDGYDLESFVVDPSKLHVSLSSNEINTVFSYGDGNLYIGTHGGLTILNLVSGSMRTYADRIDQVPHYRAFYVEPIIPDSMRHRTWIGGAHGLCYLSWSTDSLIFLLDSGFQNEMPLPEGIIDMVFDQSDTRKLWLGTVNGLFSFDMDSKTYQYNPVPGNRSFVIMDLYQDKQGVIWMAGDQRKAAQRGILARYTPLDSTWKIYSLTPSGNEQHQSTGEAYFILPALEDTLIWLSTRTGVGVFNTNTGNYDRWDYQESRPDGLLPNEFFRSMLSDRHGRLWISSWQGIQYAKIAFAGQPNLLFKPRVAITDVQVSNARADMPEPLIYMEALGLQKDQRDMTIRYVLPNPLNPLNVTYQYQLEGWDKDWVTSDQRLVQYSRLNGGKYTFHVRGKEGNGEWSEISSLPITIDHRITEYPWFWMLMVTLLGAMIIGTNRYLISRTRKEEQLKSDFNKKVSEIEMQALRAQMNPHFLFNSLNSIKYYALSKDKDATADYLTKFSLLVRTILNNSKSHTISVKEEIDALRLYIEIEHLRLEGKFEYHIDVDSSIRVEQAQMPPMILQPFVENAIWHGLMHKPSGGKLLVQVRDLGTQIQCIIEDNGIGRAKAREIMNKGSGHKKSMGMRITGDRISLINSIYGIDTQVHIIDLVNAGGVAEGTRVVINIPLINEME